MAKIITVITVIAGIVTIFAFMTGIWGIPDVWDIIRWPKKSSPLSSFPATRERIQFSPGHTSLTISTYLVEGVSKGYVLKIRERQHMIVTVTDSARIIVFNPAGEPLAPLFEKEGHWEGIVPRTGDYTVLITGAGVVILRIVIPP